VNNPPPDLVGSRIKVQRAKEQFQDLITKAQDFMNLNPYGVVIEDNPQTGERVWHARVSRPIPPEWSPLIGDIVHNLRAALDYVAWQFEAASGTRGDPRSIQFPIWDRGAPAPTTARAVKDHKAKRKRQEDTFGLPAMALIERLQPDSRRDRDWILNPLWMLHQLDIWDKHKLFVVVGGTVVNARTTIGGPGQDVHIESMSVGSPGSVVPIADGTELMRLKLGADTPNVDVKQTFTAFVAFEKTGPGQGKGVLETLDKLISFVDQALTLFAALP
jgi:hypothetical protein